MEEVIRIKIVKKDNGLFVGSVVVSDGDELTGKVFAGSITKVWGACFERADRFATWLPQEAAPPKEDPKPAPEPEQATLRAPGMAGTLRTRLPHLKLRRKQIVVWMAKSGLDSVTIDHIASWAVHTIFPSRDEVAIYLDKMRAAGIFTKAFKDGKTLYTLNKSHDGVALVIDRVDCGPGDRVADGVCDAGDGGLVETQPANPGLFGESFSDDGPPLVCHP